jgi:hypothetical protein
MRMSYRFERIVQQDFAFLGIFNYVHVRLVAALVARINDYAKAFNLQPRHFLKNNLRSVGLSNSNLG